MFRRRRKLYSSHVRKKRKQQLARAAVLLGVVCILLLAGIARVSHLPHVRITDISVEGASPVLEKKIMLFARERLSGGYFGLFARTNALLYPRARIVSTLANTFPELKYVDVSLLDMHTVAIHVREREPYAVWCGEESGTCYFIDDEGVVFATAPYFSGPVYFEITARAEGVSARAGSVAPAPLGVYLFADEEFVRITEFVRALSDLGAKPNTLRVTKRAYVFAFANSVELLANRAQDVSTTLENLGIAIETDVLDVAMLSAAASSLEYIDLRFTNRVFYK